MPKVNLHIQNQIKALQFETGANLMQVLQQNNIAITAPCGGNGTCGKCKVKVKDIGLVNSCTYYPDADIEVVMPNERESKILTHQYEHTLKLPLNPGFLTMSSPFPIGLSIDIGTTSVVFYWINLISGSVVRHVGVSNPQAKYGADVISRINYCSQPEGLKILQNEITELINTQIELYFASEGMPVEYLTRISIAANTTMLHILAGVDPTPLALVPFKAQFTEAKSIACVDVGINAHPEAKVNLMPSISAFVGADIVSGLASLRENENIKKYLFVDIGTNGEMALVTPKAIFCSATAAGPALEGANIFCGMGAFDGAISVYNNGKYQTIADEKPLGICGSGLIDIMAYLLNEGVVQSDGELHRDFVIADSEDSGNGECIIITPKDVREIQLAKSAIYTGIKILVQESGLTFDDLDAVFLAGGFGNYMNPESAIRIGLLPAELSGKIITVGNSSGAGAVLNTMSENFVDYTNKVVERAKLIELANHPDFEMEFAMNMFFE